MPRVAFVVNRLRVADPGRLRRRCLAAAAARGWETALLAETTKDDPGPGLAAGAVAAGASLVFAVGGDGTVRACAEALAGTGTALAIVPRGTANLAARALGVPPGLDAALAAGFCGSERRIDLARVSGGGLTVAGAGGIAGAWAGGLAVAGAGGLAGPGQMACAAMAGIGLDAAVVGATPDLLKRRAGWLAYAVAGAGRLATRPSQFTVRLDGGAPLRRAARCVVVGNAGLLPGGFALLPDARLDDGLLDVGILAPAGVLGWPRVGYRVLARSRRDDRLLERYRAGRVEVTADEALPREVDGDMVMPGRSLTVTVCPRALLVRVP